MRVLFSAHAAFGHVLPIVGLARALLDAGHEVRVATGTHLCPAVASLGLEPVAAGVNDDRLVAEAHRRWPETKDEPPTSWAVTLFTAIAAPAMAADLTELIASWRPDVLVREEGEYGASVAAAEAGIPWVTHGWGSPLPSRAGLEDLATKTAPLWRAAGLSPRAVEGLYGAAVFDACPRSLYGGVRPRLPVRPVRPTPIDLCADREPRRPASGRPLAYVGFGTVPLYRDQPELIARVVEALLAHGLDAVVTTGGAELAPELRSLDSERVAVEEWLSLPRLLRSCELVVSHGGAGTVLAALAAGVPLLLLPRGAPSQLRMSRACAERGVARALAPERVSRSELADALADLTADDRFRAAARELAGEIADMPCPDDAAQVLEALVRR